MTQTQLSEWPVVQEQIDRSKIKRYPYKSILGKSLTSLILEIKGEGLSSSQCQAQVMSHTGMINFLLIFPEEKEKIAQNVYISVCARYSEEKQRGRGY